MTLALSKDIAPVICGTAHRQSGEYTAFPTLLCLRGMVLVINICVEKERYFRSVACGVNYTSYGTLNSGDVSSDTRIL